jgi:hypothetical protein
MEFFRLPMGLRLEEIRATHNRTKENSGQTTLVFARPHDFD